MKSKILSLAVLFAVLMSSCKKDNTNGNEAPKLSSKDPVELSKNISVWHGTRVQGTPPTPNSTTPEVLAPEGGTVRAFNGRYAVIQPEVQDGSVAGYYIGLNGASEYFKVDYSKPRTGGRPLPGGGRRKNFLGRPLTGEDSSLVVVLPPNLTVPDTFCVTYCPYDSLGNIGQPVTTCIIVEQLGGDAASSWINDTWRYTGTRENATDPFETYVYGSWQVDEREYFCDTDSSGNSTIVPYCTSSPCTPVATDSVLRLLGDLRLGSNGAMDYTDSAMYKMLDPLVSNCTSFVYGNAEPDTYRTTGGWSMTGNRLTLIFEFTYLGETEYEAQEYIVTRPDGNTMILTSDNDESAVMFTRL